MKKFILKWIMRLSIPRQRKIVKSGEAWAFGPRPKGPRAEAGVEFLGWGSYLPPHQPG